MPINHELVGQSIRDTADAFHVEANGFRVPVGYGKFDEPLFHPIRAGKATPEQLQAALDDLLAETKRAGFDPGIDSDEALRKIVLENGLSIDCSNFAFHGLQRAIRAETGQDYTEQVYIDASTVHAGYGRPVNPWKVRKGDKLDEHNARYLSGKSRVPVKWVTDTFYRDPQYIVGAKDISAHDASRVVKDYKDFREGDILTFYKNGLRGEAIVHNALVDAVEIHNGSTTISFWHSWHSRDFAAGLRNDHAVVTAQKTGLEFTWFPEALGDPAKYSRYELRRPQGLDEQDFASII